jgi:hypothetical protein
VRRWPAPQQRTSEVDRTFQYSFGVGRRLAKRDEGLFGYYAVARHVAVELLVDAAALLARPSRRRLRILLANLRGTIKGFQSLRLQRGEIGGANPAPES